MFETLARHPDLYTIGGESHALIEHIPALSTVARGYVSNRLDKSDATADIIDELHSRFVQLAQDGSGRSINRQLHAFRLLEKTPKNALRIGFLNKVFPDAKFIFLVRDPRENISSIMQAWRSKRFVTYPSLPEWVGEWSLLLPDDWKTVIGKPLAEIATFQYEAANKGIIDGLAEIPNSRKMLLNYQELLEDPETSIEAILSFADLDRLPTKSMLKNGLPLSRYTVTKPMVGKWHANAAQMATCINSVKQQVEQLNELLVSAEQQTIEYNIDMAKISGENDVETPLQDFGRIARNALCPCGSGKKYRKCHGQLT